MGNSRSNYYSVRDLWYIFPHVYMVCVGVWCVPTTMSVLYELSYDVWG